MFLGSPNGSFKLEPYRSPPQCIIQVQGNPCCPLRELSRELRVSRRTIQNAVDAVTGKKFRDLRDELLLAKIKNLLASAPNTTIRQVSLEAGYRSPRSFARAVRRACGVSPSNFALV